MLLEVSQEEVLRDLDEKYQAMSETEKDGVVTSDGIRDLTHRDIYTMVHDPNSQAGREYLETLAALYNHK